MINDDFSETDPASPDFGWTTLGDDSIADSTATIHESVGLFSDLSQAFVVPDGTTLISFTVGGLQLDVTTGDVPPEAFEVAVLMAATSDSVTGPMMEFNGGDALLNIADDGTVHYASGVTVDGVTASGDKLADPTQPFQVTADLPVFSESVITLYFDLIRFGADTSQVQVSDIDIDTHLAKHVLARR